MGRGTHLGEGASIGEGARMGEGAGLRENTSASELWLDLLALVWPCACVVCGAPDRQLCRGCRLELRSSAGDEHRALVASGLSIHAAGPYEGALRALLIGYKHAGRTGFASILGARLEAPFRSALDLANSLSPAIVTVPSRPAKVRERGYRHVDSLTRIALRRTRSKKCRPLLLSGALRALPGRTGQVGLDPRERERNARLLRVPRRMRAALRGREVVLVDDIVTTGATVTAAARELELVGATVIAVVAVCVARRRDQVGEESHDPRAKPRSQGLRHRWN